MTQNSDPAPVSASRMLHTLDIQLLGQFHLNDGGHTVINIDAPRVQALFAYLVLHRDAPQSRQQLAFILFPDSSEAQARTNLRKLIHHLRNALPVADSFLVSDTQTLQWNPHAPFTLDTAEFENAAAHASSSAALREAVNLYRGELLPTCYDDWLVAQRERLHQKFVETLERLTLLLENQRDYRGAISYAEQLLRTDPLREETYRHLMRLYASSGDDAGARRVYQTCVTVLRRELDAEPSAETRTEFERLNHNQVVSEKTVPNKEPAAVFDPFRTIQHNLPSQLTSFVGRAQQIADLKHLLSLQNISTRARLLTLTGAGGSGKTRLAIQVAHDLLASFQEGVWFVDLSPLADSTLIPQTITAALNVQAQPGRPALDTLLDYLHGKELLLILDNCEQFVAASAELVQTLLKKCPRLQILVTSRERLNLAGETVWLVPTLSLPQADDVHWMDAPHSEAVQLFVERASSALPTFALTQQNAPIVTQICRRLDGIPLAIELAAARIKVLTPAQIATRLEDAFRLLTRGSQVAPPRQQTLRAAMDWSYALLSEKEQILFRRLSVFAGGFTLESAEQVCAGNDDTNEIVAEDILDLLSDLVDKSLVGVAAWEDGAQVRYRMLEPVREYSKSRLIEHGENTGIATRHLSAFSQFGARAAIGLRCPEQLGWLTQLSLEHENVRVALDWGIHTKDANVAREALVLANALFWFWLLRGHWSEGKEFLKRLLEHTDASQWHKQYIYALAAAGWFEVYFRNSGAARHYFEKAKSFANPLNPSDRSVIAWAQLGLAWLCRRDAAARGESIRKCKALYLASLENARESGDEWLYAHVLNETGTYYASMNEYDSGREYIEEALRRFDALGDHYAISSPLTNLGSLAKQQRNYAKAQILFEQVLAIEREFGFPRGISYNLTQLAEVARGQGNYKQAEIFCREALALVRQLGDGTEIGYILYDLGRILLGQGKDAEAKQYQREGLIFCFNARHQEDAAFCLAALACHALAEGKWTRAARLFGAAECLANQSIFSDPIDGDALARDLSRLCEYMGAADFTQARAEGQALAFENAVEYALEET